MLILYDILNSGATCPVRFLYMSRLHNTTPRIFSIEIILDGLIVDASVISTMLP
jgi:hypothetical protein